MQEELGYIEGGSQTLVNALIRAITERDGEVRLECPARRVVAEAGRVTAVDVEGSGSIATP